MRVRYYIFEHLQYASFHKFIVNKIKQTNKKFKIREREREILLNSNQHTELELLYCNTGYDIENMFSEL